MKMNLLTGTENPVHEAGKDAHLEHGCRHRVNEENRLQPMLVEFCELIADADPGGID